MTAPATGWGENSDLSVYFAETAAYTVRTPTRVIPTATVIPGPGHAHNGAIIGGIVGGVLGALILAIAILCCWIRRRRQPKRQPDGYVWGHPSSHRPSEMQGQFTQPTELPARNSAIMHPYKPPIHSTLYEQKGLSPIGSSPLVSTGSPAQSMPTYSQHMMSASTGLAPLSDTRLGSPPYQHPAHQSLNPQEYFPPPPARTDASYGSTLARPFTAHGRSYELPASRNSALVPTNVKERSEANTQSASRSPHSLT